MSDAFDLELLGVRAELLTLSHSRNLQSSYFSKHQLGASYLTGFIGSIAIARASICKDARFDFNSDGILMFICEAFAPDGETVIDLVAWPLNQPHHVLTMFGRCGLLGAWEAMSPGTYSGAGVLVMHRTPLEWLQANCRGAAVVTPAIAARQILDLPGRVAARDRQHGQYLEMLRRSALTPNKILVPTSNAS